MSFSENHKKWSEFTTVHESWIDDCLLNHGVQEEKKLKVRTFSIPFSGTTYNTSQFVDFTVESIENFVLSPQKIIELKQKKRSAWREASRYFGHTDPEKDGKYGELILYLFSEAVLKTPIIAYKLPLLTNTKDQVKGADGLYFGEYNNKQSLLIGEAKIEQSVTSAITNALDSIDRFHSSVSTGTNLDYELLISSRALRNDMSIEQLDFLYSCLKMGTKEFRNNIIVHPILIIFEDDKISKIEEDCEDCNDAEILMQTFLDERIKLNIDNIKKKITKYQKVKKVYLDFFFLPMSSVKDLRYDLYKSIHNAPYIPNPSKEFVK